MQHTDAKRTRPSGTPLPEPAPGLAPFDPERARQPSTPGVPPASPPQPGEEPPPPSEPELVPPNPGGRPELPDVEPGHVPWPGPREVPPDPRLR